VDVRLQLAKLGFIDRASHVLGTVILSIIFLVISLAVFIFLGLGLVETFSEWFDSRIGGTFTTAGLFLLVMVVIFLLRKSVINSFASMFIRIMTEGDDDDEEELKGRSVPVEGEDD
jgi:hypothetical protein